MKIPDVQTGLVNEVEGWEIAHSHPTFEISVVLEGVGEFECEGETVSLEAGHVVLIPENMFHAYRARTDMRFGVLQAEAARTDSAELFRKLTPEGQCTVLFLSPVSLAHYEELFRNWLRLVSQPWPDQEEARFLSTWLECLMLFLLQQRRAHVPSVEASIASTADHIKNSLASTIAIAKLAAQCNMSETMYRTLFKQMYGMSPKQYHQSCRKTEAKWLLRSTNRPVSHIAEQVGFATLHAFSAWFGKDEGMSPTEWRRKQQGNP